MKSVDKFDLHEEVVIEGMEGIFTVEAYFEHMYIVNEGNDDGTFELWYTVKDKESGRVNEVSYKLLSSAAQKKKEIMDDTLDQYNENLELEKLTWDSQYGVKAKYIKENINWR